MKSGDGEEGEGGLRKRKSSRTSINSSIENQWHLQPSENVKNNTQSHNSRYNSNDRRRGSHTRNCKQMDTERRARAARSNKIHQAQFEHQQRRHQRCKQSSTNSNNNSNNENKQHQQHYSQRFYLQH